MTSRGAKQSVLHIASVRSETKWAICIFLGTSIIPCNSYHGRALPGSVCMKDDAARTRAIICCIPDSGPVEEVQIRDPYTRSKEMKTRFIINVSNSIQSHTYLWGLEFYTFSSAPKLLLDRARQLCRTR